MLPNPRSEITGRLDDLICLMRITLQPLNQSREAKCHPWLSALSQFVFNRVNSPAAP